MTHAHRWPRDTGDPRPDPVRRQTGIEHHEGQPVHDEAPQRRHVVARFGRELSQQEHLRTRRLGIAEHVDPRLLVLGHAVARPIGWRSDGSTRLAGLTLRGRSEVLPHLGLDHLGVEVPHGDHGHQVGPIPAPVELSQALHGCVFDDLRQPNWASLGIARVAKNQRKPVVLKTRSKTPTEAPFFQDYAALKLDLVRRSNVMAKAQSLRI